jgi:hypothetical protein
MAETGGEAATEILGAESMPEAMPESMTESQAAPEPKMAAQRDIVISCSTLIRRWQEIAPKALEDALFLFGSKRRWVFPQNDEERRDAQRQPGEPMRCCRTTSHSRY